MIVYFISGPFNNYPLKQMDFNGDTEAFDPVFVNCEKQIKNELKIYPNPAVDFVHVEISSTENMDVQLTLFSSNGHILLLQKVQLQTGTNAIRLDISALPTGAFHLHISNDRKLEITGNRSIIKR